MSFLDRYAQNVTLADLPQVVTDNLKKVEERLDGLVTSKDEKFADVIGEYVPRIFDIYARLKAQFSGWKFSIDNTVSAFKFVINIANEVVQIVNAIASRVVPEGADAPTAHIAKVQFAKELTYFIWAMWSPRLIKWLPESVDRVVQRKVVYWLAGMAADAGFNLWDRISSQASGKLSLKAGGIPEIVKAF